MRKLQISVPEEVLNKLKQEADDLGISVSHRARILIEHGYDFEEGKSRRLANLNEQAVDLALDPARRRVGHQTTTSHDGTTRYLTFSELHWQITLSIRELLMLDRSDI